VKKAKDVDIVPAGIYNDPTTGMHEGPERAKRNEPMHSELLDQYLTPRQAAERKGVAVPTIYKAIERGQLPAVRLLNRVALRVTDVDAYQPGSYGGVQRAAKRRGPGRPPKVAALPRQPESASEAEVQA
jgi:excisionase family DNA binding protein